MSTSAAVALFPLVKPFTVPPVNLPDLAVGTELVHGIYNFHRTERWCACCDEWQPAGPDRCAHCAAPFDRSLP